MKAFGDMKYAQRQRFVFMESVAYWEGAVGRRRIAEVFHITENHVSRDFKRYREEFPNNLDYDLSARTYRPGRRFSPRVGSGSAEEYLSLLRTYLECQSVAVVPTIAEGVAAATLPRPEGILDPAILREITRALSNSKGLTVQYQSLSSPDPSTRAIWPHALVYAGLRWHVRAYDSAREEFIDLVLNRFATAAALDQDPPAPVTQDKDWLSIVTVDVGLSSKLNEHQQAVVAKEYGMVRSKGEWVWHAKVKRCLVPYFRTWLRLDLPEDKSWPLRLINRDQLEELKFKTLE